LFCIFYNRSEESCVIICLKNYEKKLDEKSGKYKCIPKECEDRRPYRNKSCSVKEDFLLLNNNNSDSLKSGCYYLRDKNNTDNVDDNSYYYDDSEVGGCVREENCPSDFFGV
jgi:hypothetical protein